MDTDVNNDRTLKVQLFKKFLISCDEIVVAKESFPSEIVGKCAAYIFSNRKKALSLSNIRDIFYPGSDVDDVQKDIQNHIFDFQLILKANFGDKEYILSEGDAFRWNPDVPLAIDCEIFEQSCNQVLGAETDVDQIEYGKRAMQYYKGSFLLEYYSEFWVVSLSSYYHSIYISTVKMCIEAMIRENQLIDAESACREAIKVDALDEELHLALINTLIAEEETQEANRHYHETVLMLNNEFGSRPSDELNTIYKRVLKKQQDAETDIYTVCNNLLNQSWHRGPLFCDYEMFQKIYTLMSYNGGRLGITGQVVLITIAPKHGTYDDPKENRDLLESGMFVLKNAMEESLRTNDMVCRLSPTQYVILLTACKYEAGIAVVERIISNVDMQDKIDIHYALNEIAIM